MQLSGQAAFVVAAGYAGTSAAQVALAWVMTRPAITSFVVRARRRVFARKLRLKPHMPD